MSVETKQDFSIANKQQEILDELQSKSFHELFEMIKADGKCTQEFKDGAQRIISENMTADDIVELLPENVTDLLRFEAVEILFNKEWNRKQ